MRYLYNIISEIFFQSLVIFLIQLLLIIIRCHISSIQPPIHTHLLLTLFLCSSHLLSTEVDDHTLQRNDRSLPDRFQFNCLLHALAHIILPARNAKFNGCANYLLKLSLYWNLSCLFLKHRSTQIAFDDAISFMFGACTYVIEELSIIIISHHWLTAIHNMRQNMTQKRFRLLSLMHTDWAAVPFPHPNKNIIIIHCNLKIRDIYVP